MSDFAWVALIAIIYFVVIRPLFQGAVNKPVNDQNSKTEVKNKRQSPSDSHMKNNDDYVDYEELK